MKITLANDIEKKIFKYPFLWPIVPTFTNRAVTKLPQFYTDQFLKNQEVSLKEYKEHRMTFHTSEFIDKDASSDMHVMYDPNHAIIRDLSSSVINKFKGRVGVFGGECIAKAIRYAQDTNNQIEIFDSKRNLLELSEYQTRLNQVQIKAHKGDIFKQLSQNQFDVLDIETPTFSQKKFLQLVLPAIDALKEDGLLIYTIEDYIRYMGEHQSLGQFKKSVIGANHSNTADTIHYLIQATISKIQQLAAMSNKHVKPIYFQTSRNLINPLTLYLQVKKGALILEDKFMCQTCGKEQYAIPKCEQQSCQTRSLGQLMKGPLIDLQFVKSLDTEEFPNHQILQRLFEQHQDIEGLTPVNVAQSLSIPIEDALSFVNDAFRGYKCIPSCYTPQVIYTDAPFSHIQDVLSTINNIYQGLDSSLLKSDFKMASFLMYRNAAKAAVLPRDLKIQQQQRFGWE